MLKIGDKAPDFALRDDSGVVRSLKDYEGKKVVLYFYSKDMTSGCTRQAEGYRDLADRFEALGAVILGVSKDTPESHQRFRDKYSLNFKLLSDPELGTIKAYGVWQEKKNYGKTVMGVVRTTYLIDENGIILYSAGKVKAAEDPTNTLRVPESL